MNIVGVVSPVGGEKVVLLLRITDAVTHYG